MKHEFYDIAFRKKVYQSLSELQQDVEQWLLKYNQLRPHSGTRCDGKTPWQTFQQAKALAKDKQLDTLYEVGHNDKELAKFETSSTEEVSNVGSIAPSDEMLSQENKQGAKLEMLNTNSELTDKLSVD